MENAQTSQTLPTTKSNPSPTSTLIGLLDPGIHSPTPLPPVTKNSTEFTKKEEQSKHANYLKNFSPPYTVYLENAEQNGSALYDINVCKILKRNNVKNAVNVDTINKQRVKIDFDIPESANNFLKHPLLGDNKLKAYIPKQYTQKIGVIRNIDQSIPDDEILANLSSSCNVVSICRLNRRVRNPDGRLEYVQTSSIRVTFHTQQLPEKVYFYLAPRKVVPYIFRVTQCFQCLRYGHVAKICKSRSRCTKCGKAEHEESACPGPDNCVHCHLNHKATDRNCPEFQRQKIIKKAMSVNALTYKEANTKYPPLRNSFSPLDMISDFPELSPLNPEAENSPNMEYISYKKALTAKYKKNNKKRKYNSSTESPPNWESNIATPLNEIEDKKGQTSYTNPHKTSAEQKFIGEISTLLVKLQSKQYSEKESLDLIGSTLYEIVKRNENLISELRDKYKPPD